MGGLHISGTMENHSCRGLDETSRHLIFNLQEESLMKRKNLVMAFIATTLLSLAGCGAGGTSSGGGSSGGTLYSGTVMVTISGTSSTAPGELRIDGATGTTLLFPLTLSGGGCTTNNRGTLSVTGDTVTISETNTCNIFFLGTNCVYSGTGKLTLVGNTLSGSGAFSVTGCTTASGSWTATLSKQG